MESEVSDEELVQQLAERLTDLTYLGRQLTPGHATQIVRAVLTSGLVVPAADVLDVAQELERDSQGRASYLAIANWLRALVDQGEPGPSD